VSNQLSVKVEGTSIAVVDGGNGSSNSNGSNSGSSGNGGGGSDHRGSSVAEGRGIGVGLTLDSEVISTGSGNSGLINRDNSAIGVGNQAVESSGVSSAIDGGGSGSSVQTSSNSLGGQMVSTGSGDSGLINRDNSAVGVSNQLSVKVEGTSIAVVDGGNGSSNSNGSNSGSSGNGGGGSDHRGSSVAEGRGIGVGLTLDSKVVSTGSGNSRLINRDNSAIGVSDQLSVEVEGASIAIGGGVARVASVGNRGSVIASVSHSRGSSDGASGIASIANSGGSSIANWGNSSLEGQMISTGSGHSGLINWDNSAIGEGLESIEALGGSGGNTSGENQKLHD